MGFSSVPSSCSYITGKFRYIKEIDEKIKLAIESEKKFVLFNIILAIVCIAGACFLFNFVFGKIYRRVMAEKIDQAVEDAIGNYKAMKISSEDTEYEMGSA